jgi:spermidine synthase
LLLATTLLVGPPVLLVSTVFPMLVELRPPDHSAGSVAGKLVAISTLGSLVGTLVPGLWLIPELGVRVTALLVGGLVATAGAATWVSAPRARVAVPLMLLAMGGGALIVNGPGETEGRVVRETPYGLLELDYSPLHVSLRVNGVSQSAYSPPMLRRGYLLRSRKYLELLPCLRPHGRRVLDIGLGAGLVARCLTLHGLDVESVEVNAPLAALVRHRLGYEGVVHVDDGRRFLNTCRATFDHVILDVFHGESLPVHLMTREAFRSAKRRLAANGILAVHLIGAPDTRVTASVARTLRAVFAEILCVRSGIGNELQDLYLFASDAPLPVPRDPALEREGWLGNEAFDPPERGAELLTDDRNPIEILNRPAARALRRLSRSSL